MDNSDLKSKLSLEKDLMRSWLEYIPNINLKRNDEAEKVLKDIYQKLQEISKTNFFLQESFESDNEKFFLNTFIPQFIKKLTNESMSSSYIKDLARKILQLLFDEMIRSFDQNVNKFLDIWESIAESFGEDRYFNQTYLIDSADKFLVKYIN
jgi:hypothetical protein